MARRREDLTGQRFGRLTIVKRLERTDGHSAWYLCKCDCGNTKEVRGSCLKRGDTRSCGCLNVELSSARGKKFLTKHGWYGTKAYNTWHGIKDRCYSPNCPQYANYGGRGIEVCDEWKNDPEAFCEWAMANGCAEGMSIDRIDVNGNYEPSNCRWLSMDEQQANKRNNVTISYKGKTQCVAEWARELGVRKFNLYYRIRAGWENPEEILFGKMKGVKNYG